MTSEQPQAAWPLRDPGEVRPVPLEGRRAQQWASLEGRGAASSHFKELGGVTPKLSLERPEATPGLQASH